MKIRSGFVSNSSSSSFCLVGFEKYNNNENFETLWKAEGFPTDDDAYEKLDGKSIDNGIYQGEFLIFAGGPCLEASRAVGLDAKELLERMSIKQARKYIQTLLKDKFDVTVKINSIDLVIGESSNEY